MHEYTADERKHDGDTHGVMDGLLGEGGGGPTRTDNKVMHTACSVTIPIVESDKNVHNAVKIRLANCTG